MDPTLLSVNYGITKEGTVSGCGLFQLHEYLSVIKLGIHDESDIPLLAYKADSIALGTHLVQFTKQASNVTQSMTPAWRQN